MHPKVNKQLKGFPSDFMSHTPSFPSFCATCAHTVYDPIRSVQPQWALALCWTLNRCSGNSRTNLLGEAARWSLVGWRGKSAGSDQPLIIVHTAVTAVITSPATHQVCVVCGYLLPIIPSLCVFVWKKVFELFFLMYIHCQHLTCVVRVLNKTRYEAHYRWPVHNGSAFSYDSPTKGSGTESSLGQTDVSYTKVFSTDLRRLKHTLKKVWKKSKKWFSCLVG